MDAIGADDRPVDLSGPDDPPPAAKKPRQARKRPARALEEFDALDDLRTKAISPAKWQRLERERIEAELEIWKKKVGYVFKLGLIALVVLGCLFTNVLGDRLGAGGVPVWLVLMILPMLFLWID